MCGPRTPLPGPSSPSPAPALLRKLPQTLQHGLRDVEIARTDTGFQLRDVGSLNGTYVNRDLVDECLLRNGDEVQIGKFRLVYFGSTRGTE